jgi:glycosyltransferase involved in cell wall biosynthesis
MQAGFENSSGKIVISIDADLQNDPADIPLLIDKMKHGYDVVCGWRKNRKDKFVSRRIPSITANWLISKITGLKLHDYGCTLRAYRSEAVKAISLYGDMHRFIPVYAFWEGASVAEITVNHRKRASGKSKYNISRTYKVLLDLLTIKFLRDYSTRPSYLFGGIGLFLCFCASVLAAVSVAKKILFGIFIHKDPLMLFAVMFFLMGTFCILEGLLAEIIIRFYHESTHKPIYSVKERINF